ncbi:vWA domain-containing protein [Alteromonas macleodii]|uniref:vWA domain-containing protein n=1 Tax=Alteromonas macleodii TaxID=28108 RepID=UPI0020768B23|nr:vWA domain-containing protein [Alteromonas macleodii]USI27901.1 VWA domain-containing protein [Alteromonas macleodii]
MSYDSEISRSQPTAILFIVDQSASMSDRMPSERSKADFVSDVLNRSLVNLITRCTKGDGTRDYFDIGVIGYGHTGARNGFQGSLANSVLNPISAVEASPLRVEDRMKKVDDGAGGLVEIATKFPVWFESNANGGTPMCEALTLCAEELVNWCDSHPESYPPTVIHITDGESTDGSPEEIANALKQISTNNGQTLLLNLHVSSSAAKQREFPDSDIDLPDSYSKMLFKMSSMLPPHLVSAAKEKGYSVSAESKGFIFNADASAIVDFFDIGTRTTQLR